MTLTRKCSARRMACYALAVQIYFAWPTTSLMTVNPFLAANCNKLRSPRPLAPVYSTPEDLMATGGQPPKFNATSLSPDEELPDDVPKDVTPEKLQATIDDKERTLYDILGASPTATRAQLKRSYAQMAKLSHPDAQIGRDDNYSDEDNIPDFGQVAAAWRILGDSKSRKRYDRELQYKEWSATASKYANEKLEEAVPAVAKIMDNVAVPFIRRTAATTFAVGQAVSKIGKSSSSQQDVDNGSDGNKGIGDVFLDALKAGRNAAMAIDSMELKEKSDDLRKKAETEQKKVEEIKEELSAVTEQRLMGALNSDAFRMSSEEANLVLERLAENYTESDMNLQRNRVEREINLLEATEKQFTEKLKVYEETDMQWNSLLQKQEGAKNDLSRSKQEELEARRRLDEAIRMVAEAKANLVTTSTALKGIEQKVKKNAYEMDRITHTLTKKQQRVREVLKAKAEKAKGGIQINYLSDSDLTALKRREVQLTGEREQLNRMVARLSSRAKKLSTRAVALERYQKNEGGSVPANGFPPNGFNGLQ